MSWQSQKAEPRRSLLIRVLGVGVGAVMMVVVVLLVSGHVGVARDLTAGGVKDAAGMTRGEVARLDDEEQFALIEARYRRMQELLTPAQLQVNDGEWVWLAPGLGPYVGPLATDPLDGATSTNSYFMEMGRAFRPEGARGERADAEPVLAYFKSQGYDAEIVNTGAHRWDVYGVTDDGYVLKYSVQENGQYNMVVQSRLFWGDGDNLWGEILYRLPGGAVFPPKEESLPGVYTQFPKWSDPEVWDISMPGNPDAWRQQ